MIDGPATRVVILYGFYDTYLGWELIDLVTGEINTVKRVHKDLNCLTWTMLPAYRAVHHHLVPQHLATSLNPKNRNPDSDEFGQSRDLFDLDHTICSSTTNCM